FLTIAERKHRGQHSDGDDNDGNGKLHIHINSNDLLQ
ncbi:MAG: hypothetical protein ACI898_001688, partial [Flavobacteriales bacterium]